MRGKAKPGSKRENVRIAIILLVGLPILIYTYVYYLGDDRISLPKPSLKSLEKAREVAAGWVSKLKSSEEEEEGEEPKADKDELFAPGSAGNLALMNKNLKIRGREMSPEDQRAAVKRVFRDGKMYVDEE
jgi:hypothetical protein